MASTYDTTMAIEYRGEKFEGYNKPKRHAKNIKKGKLSAAYWADKVKW